jgi:hypothetical protein
MMILLQITGVGWMLLYLQQRHRIQKEEHNMIYGMEDNEHEHDHNGPSADNNEQREVGDQQQHEVPPTTDPEQMMDLEDEEAPNIVASAPSSGEKFGHQCHLFWRQVFDSRVAPICG